MKNESTSCIIAKKTKNWNLDGDFKAIPSEAFDELEQVKDFDGNTHIKLESLVKQWIKFNNPMTWIESQREQLDLSTNALYVATTLFAQKDHGMTYAQTKCICCSRQKLDGPQILNSSTEAADPWIPYKIFAICPACQESVLYRYGNWRAKRFGEPKPIIALTPIKENLYDDALKVAQDLAKAADELDHSGKLKDSVIAAFHNHFQEGMDIQPSSGQIPIIIEMQFGSLEEIDQTGQLAKQLIDSFQNYQTIKKSGNIQ